jgi:hypothetical protein
MSGLLTSALFLLQTPIISTRTQERPKRGTYVQYASESSGHFPLSPLAETTLGRQAFHPSTPFSPVVFQPFVPISLGMLCICPVITLLMSHSQS